MESTNEAIDLNFYIIDNISFFINFFTIGSMGISAILKDILLFSFTFAGRGLFKCYSVSTFTYNWIKPHGELFEGRGLIVNITSFDMGDYSRGSLIEGTGLDQGLTVFVGTLKPQI